MIKRRFLLQVGAVISFIGAGSFSALRALAQSVGPRLLIVHRAVPLNAEPPPGVLGVDYLTNVSDFYVRCHGNIPQVPIEGYRLHVGGQTATHPLNLSMKDLRERFARRSMIAVMQCAGNRRADMAKVKSVSGDGWGPGAIGNARWSGVSLGEVLKATGINSNADLHVAFQCHDDVEEEAEHFKFGVSIPLLKAMDSDTLLAFEMNGSPLTPEHGFPLRLVTPGWAGVRSPKWIETITVQDRPSDSRIQQKEYKLFPGDASKETVDVKSGFVIDEMPLNSAILEPSENAKVPAGPTLVRGYAIASARPIARVEVSRDDGEHWQQAELQQHGQTRWGWTLWTTSMDLPRGDIELSVRAWDSAGETQVATTAQIWNFPGYLSAAWHRVQVHAS